MNDSCYMSASFSPGRISMESMGFFSLPTSPRRRTLEAANGLQTKPTSPKTREDSSTFTAFDEFEFATSRHFDVDDFEVEVKTEPKSECQSEDLRKASLPAMAFADELFSDGKVMHLKPPPRLQFPNDKSSPLSSPRSPTGVLKLPFQRRTLWNDDFDPFMVALKNVKEEEVGKSEAKFHRRSRSMSPFRDISPKKTNELFGSSQQQINEMGLILPTKQSVETNPEKKMEESKETALVMWVPGQNKQMGYHLGEQVKQVNKSPIKLAEPKGVLFARRARLVKVGDIVKPKKALEAIQHANENGVTCTKETRSQRFQNFLSRTASMGKTSSNENKPQSSNVTESRPTITKKFSFKSIGLSRPHNDEKRLSKVTRMTLIQYRPKLLLCMGYGAKNVQ